MAGSREWSAGSTPPPGKTTVEGANAIVVTRRCTNTSGPPAPSRTIITVAAGRAGTTTLSASASQSRARASSPGSLEMGWWTTVLDGPDGPGAPAASAPRPMPSVPDVDDDLDLHRGVERKRDDTDR